jgi:hypothetical protein
VIHGNQTVHVPDAYGRYLANVFRKTFDLFATPVSLEFRTDANPFTAGKRERRESAGRPGKSTAKNPGSKNRRAANEHLQKRRRKSRKDEARSGGKPPSGSGRRRRP